LLLTCFINGVVVLDDHLVVRFLRHYGQGTLTSIDFSSYPWEILIRQARRTNLLSRCAFFLCELELLDKVPKQPRIHFINSIKLSDANARSAKVEVKQIYKALSKAKVDFVLLKGAAYVWAGNNASKGRLFTDTDILVAKENLVIAETALANSGWLTSSLDVYTQKFYREWMHEIPPMTHLKRQTTIDVHHTIIPPTSRLKPKPIKFWQQADAAEDMPGLYVLSPIDMIIHSATHLFHEGEFEQGLRDISDLDLLIREAIASQNGWDKLLHRAVELDLVKPVYYALNFTKKILDAPIPEDVINRAIFQAKMSKFDVKLMDVLYGRALATNHVTNKMKGQGVARWFLYIRSHWLKMPVHLLFPHLFRKSWLNLTGQKDH